jgi:phasin family protein
MVKLPEQITELNKNSVEAALDFARISMDSAERMLRLQLQAAKDFVAEQGQAAKAIAGAENTDAITALRDQLTEGAVDRVLGYSRGVCDVATQMQKQLTGLIEQHFADYQKELAVALEQAVKSAPGSSATALAALQSTMAATQTAMDNMTKAARQISELADVNVKAMSDAAASALKSQKKP